MDGPIPPWASEGAACSRASQLAIGRQLGLYFETIRRAPLPQRLTALLERLDDLDGNAPTGRTPATPAERPAERQEGRQRRAG